MEDFNPKETETALRNLSKEALINIILAFMFPDARTPVTFMMSYQEALRTVQRELRKSIGIES